MHILGEDLQEMPIGTKGVLYIGGPSLLTNYLQRPDLTADAVVDHPRFGRLYNSGDLARFRPSDGAIMFCGRADFQVKIRGQRGALQGSPEGYVVILRCPATR